MVWLQLFRLHASLPCSAGMGPGGVQEWSAWGLRGAVAKLAQFMAPDAEKLALIVGSCAA